MYFKEDIMNNKTIDYKYLTNELQFPEATAKAIIRQAKIKMVKSGYAIYNNKRLGTVPIFAVEEILGFKLLDKKVTYGKNKFSRHLYR